MDLYERLENRLNNRIKQNREEYEKRQAEVQSKRRAYNSQGNTNKQSNRGCVLCKQETMPSRFPETAEQRVLKESVKEDLPTYGTEMEGNRLGRSGLHAHPIRGFFTVRWKHVLCQRGLRRFSNGI